MWKLIAFLCLFFISVRGQCGQVSLTSFCGTITGNVTTDSAYASIVGTMQTVYSQFWPQWESALKTALQNAGITPCDDCITAMKHMTCASLLPGCGFLACITPILQRMSNCTLTCVNSAACQTVVAGTAYSGECFGCIQNCYNSNSFATCAPYMLSRSMCQEFVRVCGCTTDTTILNDVCQYFAVNGVDYPFPSGLTCSSSPGWCSSSSTVTASKTGVCPNKAACFIPSQVSGQQTYGNTAQVTESASSPANSAGANLIFLLGSALLFGFVFFV